MKTTLSPFLYNQDFNLWVESTLKLLKQNRFDELDIKNLISEVESMGNNDKKLSITFIFNFSLPFNNKTSFSSLLFETLRERDAPRTFSNLFNNSSSCNTDSTLLV